MNNNVIEMNQNNKKTERFGVFLGELNSTGELKEKERIGSAYMKRGTKQFRLKLWLMNGTSYFIVTDFKDQSKYRIVVPEEFHFSDGGAKTRWHQVGEGTVSGTYIKLKIYLLAEDFFLSMFPDKFQRECANYGNEHANDRHERANLRHATNAA